MPDKLLKIAGMQSIYFNNWRYQGFNVLEKLLNRFSANFYTFILPEASFLRK